MSGYAWLIVVLSAVAGGVAGGCGGWVLKSLTDRQHRRLLRAYVREAAQSVRGQECLKGSSTASGQSAHAPESEEETATAVFVPGKRAPARVARSVPPPLPAAALRSAASLQVDGLHTAVVADTAWRAFTSEVDGGGEVRGAAGETTLFNQETLTAMLAEERASERVS